MSQRGKYILICLIGCLVIISGAFSLFLATTPQASTNPIELRFTANPPPEPEPDYWVCLDVASMPAKLSFGLTVFCYNSYSQELYFELSGAGENYAFTKYQVGSIKAGSKKHVILTDFFTRDNPKPILTGILKEKVTITLKAYLQSNYTQLKFEYSRPLFIKLIDSSSEAFSIALLEDFEDKEVGAWSHSASTGVTVSKSAATDFVYAGSYSLKISAKESKCTSGNYWFEAIRKVSIPVASEAYGILHLRLARDSLAHIASIRIYVNGKQVAMAGIANPTSKDYVELNRWLQFAFPLPVNKTVELKIRVDFHREYSSSGGYVYQYLWLDDLKFIYKP